ncbi:unnamed protein product [Urochloa humidicola]
MKGKKGAIVVLLALMALSLLTKNCSARPSMIELPSLIQGGPVVSGGGPGDSCGVNNPCNSPFICRCSYSTPTVCICDNIW